MQHLHRAARRLDKRAQTLHSCLPCLESWESTANLFGPDAFYPVYWARLHWCADVISFRGIHHLGQRWP